MRTIAPSKRPPDPPDSLVPPSLVLGAMNFGKRTPADESDRIVRRALERGIRVFDTANAYNAGESERILGRALGRERERVIVSTKAGLGLVPGKPEGLAPEAMFRAFDASLGRLGTDRIDIYYLHVPDRSTPIEQTLGAMKELLGSGRVRAWGVSNYAAWELLEMIHWADAHAMARPTVSQALYNALHRQVEVEYLAFARRYAIETVAYNALAGGLLAGGHRWGEAPAKGTRFDGNRMYQRRYWTAAMFDRVALLDAIARDEGSSLLQLSYGWLASRADVDSILLGPATVVQLDAALDAVAKIPSKTAIARIDELALQWSGSDTNYVR